MLCKATGILTIFFLIFIGCFRGLKLNQYFKTVKKKKKRKKKGGGPNWAETGLAGRTLTRARAQRHEASIAPAQPPSFSLFFLLFYLFFFFSPVDPRRHPLPRDGKI
jgi:hypothetical protein